jgi:hypothetical protein
LFCDKVTPCKKTLPDIIIPRRYLLSQDFIDRMENNLKSGQYQKVMLPILDYPSNNIPEFSFSLRHLYKTPHETDPDRQVILYIRK